MKKTTKAKTAKKEISFDDFIKSRKEIIETALDRYFPPSIYPQKLGESIRYSLLAGGKRIRPMLTLAVADLFSTPYEHVLPFACAIEAIHTYSLIHDDLPAMDNDDYRRGKLTNHKVYGEAVAILAGDALLTEAFRVMTDESIKNNIAPKKALAAIREVSTRCGINGIVGGQVMDILSENTRIDVSTLQYIHIHKTGALMLASIMTGAMVSKAKESDLANLARYGKCVGLAFQIMDDLLDEEGNFEKLGKKPGADAARHKNTYPSLLGMKQSRDIFDRLMETALGTISQYGDKASILRGFVAFLKSRSS